MKNFFFVIPVFKDIITGGTKYDFKIVSELKKKMFKVNVIPYEYKKHNKLKLLLKVFNIPDNSIICIDALLAPFMKNVIPILNKKFEIIFLIHHPTSQENANNPMILINNYFAERITYSHSHKLIVVSSYIEKQTKKFLSNRKKIFTVNPGIDNIFFKQKHKKNRNNVICIGNIIERKGYDVLIEAMSKIPGNWKLFIIGNYNVDEKYFSSLKKKICEYNLGDKIQFLGTLKQKKLISYMKKSKIFVSPTYFEGFGIALLESAIFGLKVITSDLPVLRDTLKSQNVDYITPGNVNEFAKSISINLNSKNKMKTSYSREQFTWKNSARKFLYAIKK